MYEIMCFDEYGNSIDEFIQWDTNRVMYIDWEHSCEPIFQFGNTKSDRLLVVKGRITEGESNKIAEVNVPNILLQQAYPIIGFVYLESEVDGNENYYTGKTAYNFKIPVRAKNKPEDYKYTENTEYISWIKLESKARTYLSELEVETNRFKAEYEDTLGIAKDNADRAVQAAEQAKLSEDNAKVSENKAKDSENNANISKVAAKNSEEASKVSENNSRDSELASKQSEENAASSEQNAKDSENNAKISEGNAKLSEVNAKEYEENAARSETKAKESEVNAKNSEDNARVSEANTKISETNAKNSEVAAKASEVAAKDSENAAKSSEDESYNFYIKTKEAITSFDESLERASETINEVIQLKESVENLANVANEVSEIATNADNSAKLSKSYAVGETNTRTDEDIDNAKYYYVQTKAINDSIGGAFLPQGTIEFSELKSVTKSAGWVYHISNDFVTDDSFKCGAGVLYPAGTNVYYTFDGYWDCFVENLKTVIVADDDNNGNVIIKHSYDSATIDEQYSILNKTIATLQKRIEALESQSVLEVVE